MNRRMIIIAALLLTGCDEMEKRLKDISGTATEIVFTSVTSSVATNAVISSQADIARILHGLDVGSMTPYSKHPFQHQMTIILRDSTSTRIEFEQDIYRTHCFIRDSKQQFTLSRRSFELLMKEMGIQQGH